MSEWVIRKAKRADRDHVLRFHRELYVNYRDQIAAPEVIPLFAYRDLDRALRDDVDALLAGHDSVVLLAEREQRVLGYISGHIENDPRRVLSKKGVVEDWYVLPETRGRGTGKQLMEALIERFREQGCVVVESATWAFNEHARRAHQLAGFTEIEVRMRRRL